MFNVNGPDGIHSYWKDNKKEPLGFSTRQKGVDSIMKWGAIRWKNKLNIEFLHGKISSSDYLNMLTKQFPRNRL